MATKGSDYEREFCKRLSLWWTRNERDDVFWRAQNSGGRATSRFARGRRTAGQYGDVAATDPIGKPLTDLITWELKRGYSTQGIQDMFDCEDANAVRELEQFFWQATDAAAKAETWAWALVVRRNHRRAFMWFPRRLLVALRNGGAIRETTWPFMTANLTLRKKKNKVITETRPLRVAGMPVDDFLATVRPRHIRAIYDDR